MKVRCFISIELESSIKNNINDFILQNNLKKIFSGIRWIKPDNLHITLAFLGDIPTDGISDVKKILTEIAQNHMPFYIELSGLGFFPNLKHPRVLWIGIKEQLNLLKLKDDIDKKLDVFDISYDKKPFSPHLTIGRIRDTFKIEPRAVAELEFKDSFLVTEIYLMKSDLSPTGANYTNLYNVKLG